MDLPPLLHWNILFHNDQLLTLNTLNCFKDYQGYIHIWIISWIWLSQNQMLSVLYSQNNACGCSGDFRSLGINRHGIGPTKLKYSVSHIRKVNNITGRDIKVTIVLLYLILMKNMNKNVLKITKMQIYTETCIVYSCHEYVIHNITTNIISLYVIAFCFHFFWSAWECGVSWGYCGSRCRQVWVVTPSGSFVPPPPVCRWSVTSHPGSCVRWQPGN